jgi:protein involved in polysaccharide export with SLBB domain
MNDPSVVFQYDLQHNDIIHVPVAKTIVEVTGAVNRPMKYELTDNETLLELIQYAGGISANAYPDFVQIQRFENGSIRFLEYDLGSVLSGSQRVALMNGDQVRLRQINVVARQQVVSAGSVVYPEAFGYTSGMTAGDLVKLSGGLMPSASEVAYVVRRDLRNPTRSEYLPVNLLTSQGLGFVLQANDSMMVYDRTLYSTVGDVRITGAVKQPAELVFDSTLRLADVFKSAGGFALGAARNRVEVFRTTISTDRPVSLSMITLEIDSLFNVVGGDDMAFQLKPYDQIVVRQTPGFQVNRTVEINGEVQYPGLYVLESRQTTLSDVVAAAGGVRGTADTRGIRLFRTYRNRGFIVSDLSKSIQNRGDAAHDPILFEGDVITIPRRENVVSINPTGVRYQNAADPEMVDERLAITYQGSKSAHWYITRFAGGFDKEADKNSVTVTLPNGQVKSTSRFLFFRNYPTVESGSMISVQMKPPPDPDTTQKFDWDQTINRTLQTTTTILTLMILSKQL